MEPIEQHPWNWYGATDSKTLLVGTFPPTQRNWSFDFFYPNKRNFFWKILSAITGKELLHTTGEAAVTERRALLDELKITITDMGKTITRKDNNSLDENLEALAYMDIFNILEVRPAIKKIIFTSSSGKVSAVKWFLNYLESKGIKHRFPKTPKPVKSELVINGRTLELVILFSPSARAANRISFENLVTLYRDELT
ncbi:MAG: hypothetical protein EOP54_06850 [Sphingobacteriales bacterium]|nr:MAG: hypothetical protein EOP54_06850 [Sphingobacteriales bacterium]